VNKSIDSSNSKVVPEIINGRTMLPLRFVTENLGCTVQWDGNSQKISILSSNSHKESPTISSRSINYNSKTYNFDFIKINPRDFDICAVMSPNGIETAVDYNDFLKLSQQKPVAMINGIPFDTVTHDLSGSVISHSKLYYVEAGTPECIGIDSSGRPFYEEGTFQVILTTDTGRTLKTYSINQKSWGGFTIYTNWYKKEISVPDDYLVVKINKYGVVVQKSFGVYVSFINPATLADGEFYILAYNFDYNPKDPSIEILNEAKSISLSVKINNREVYSLNSSCMLAIQSAPVVVKSGLPFRGETRYPGNFRMEKYGPRAFVGFDKNGYFYFIVCKTSVSFVKDNVSEALASLKIFDYVLSLDGGGSTTLYYNGKYLYTPGRDLVNVLMVLPQG